MLTHADSPMRRSSHATAELTTCTIRLSQPGRSRPPPSTRPCREGSGGGGCVRGRAGQGSSSGEEPHSRLQPAKSPAARQAVSLPHLCALLNCKEEGSDGVGNAKQGAGQPVRQRAQPLLALLVLRSRPRGRRQAAGWVGAGQPQGGQRQGSSATATNPAPLASSTG